MFFLRANSKSGPVILHVRGYSNEEGYGFFNGEGIFEVEQTDARTMNVVRQVGVVLIEANQLTFNYTDTDFKKEIEYKEESGYSTLDGGLWQVRRANYLNSEGKSCDNVNPHALMHFMYSSAKNPLLKLPNLATLFSQANTRHERINQTVPEQKQKRCPCAIL